VFNEKFLSMYALGLTTRQIQDHLKEIYAVDVSPELVSRATDVVKEQSAEWRSRPLGPLYLVLFLDALRVNIWEGSSVVKKSMYLALAIRIDGQKELLGLWIEQNEGAKFWMGILNELKNRGEGQDILLAAVGGLTTFSCFSASTTASNLNSFGYTRRSLSFLLYFPLIFVSIRWGKVQGAVKIYLLW
jgi:transposase-like protein